MEGGGHLVQFFLAGCTKAQKGPVEPCVPIVVLLQTRHDLVPDWGGVVHPTSPPCVERIRPVPAPIPRGPPPRGPPRSAPPGAGPPRGGPPRPTSPGGGASPHHRWRRICVR